MNSFQEKNFSLEPENMSAPQPISEAANKTWSVFFGLEAAAAVIGNALVIAAFIASDKLQKRKTYFLLISLAVADFLVGALAIPLYIHVIGGSVTQWWTLHSHMQHTQRAIEIFASWASIIFLVVIALERVYAAVSPFSHDSLKPIGYYIVIGFVWIFAAVIGILSFLRESHVGAADKDVVFYFLMLMISLSMLIIIISYIVVVIFLLRAKFSDQYEQKMAVTLLMLTVIFVVSWLPFKVLNYIFYLEPRSTLGCYHDLGCVYQILYATKFLHYFNSVVNPLVYALRVKDFRDGVRRVLCCRCATSPPPPTFPLEREKGFENPVVSMQSLDSAVPSMFL